MLSRLGDNVGVRLLGYWLDGHEGPVQRGYLPLGGLTVVVGANDTGKTRLLRTLGECLDNQVAAAGVTRMLLAEPSDEEATQVLDAAASEAAESAKTLGRLTGGTVDIDSEARSARAAFSPMDHPSALLLGFEAAPNLQWTIYAKPLAGTECDPTGCPDASVVSSLAGDARFSVVTQSPLLPRPINVPCSTPALTAEVSAVVVGMAAHLRWAATWSDHVLGINADESWDLFEGTGPMLERALAVPSDSEWFEFDEDDGHATVSPQVIRVCVALSEIASARLPSFLSDRYQVAVRPVAMRDALNGGRMTVGLTDREGRTYPSDRVSDGLQLWIQLAVFEALDVVRAAEADLFLAFRHWGDAATELEEQLREVESTELVIETDLDRRVAQDLAETTEARREALSLASGLYSDALARMEAILVPGDPGRFFRFQRIPWGVPISGWLDEDTSSVYLNRLRALRPPLYLIDEPERHLNPRIQREAAQWLASMVREGRGQAVVSTHAPAFLSLPADVQYVSATRSPDGAVHVSAFDQAHLTALSELASELGFDRGELLGTTRCILFVEGRADQRLLESLFRGRLHGSGILVVPIQGVGRHGQILDSDVLLRYVRCPTAVLFDNLTETEIHRLKTDPAYVDQSLRSPSTELQNMAHLFKNAALHGHSIEPMGVPSEDIFDLLDENILRQTYPRYPGRAAARQSRMATPEKNRPRWKTYLELTYGVPAGDPALYSSVGDNMHSTGRIPPALARVIDDVERLALFPSA